MKPFRATLCFLAASFVAGCYSVEQSIVERGYRWIHRGKMDQALETFDFAVEKYPASVLAHTGRADALFEAHRDRDAVTAYTQALQLFEAHRPPSNETRGDGELIGHRTLSYQNQGLRFPFGLEAYLHLRRAGASGAHALAPPALDRDALRQAIADYDYALTLAPDYTAARDARDRLLKAAKEKPAPDF